MSARACACVCAFFQSNGSKGMSRLDAREATGVKTPSGWISLQPHSWLLFAGRQRCSVHTEAAGGLATKHFETLAALSHRTRITITFIIRQQNESTGPKTRPVPAA
ncbi:Hypothetical predicted protein [Scomber scombrus]|uniref:Secreted protein n=1 Tax=Scomber scombrus TaxID=13677 RepID=A0AAV1PKB8_SCOSC